MSAGAEWLSAWSILGTGVVAVAALVFAVWQLREAKSSRELVRELDIERAQPYVVMYVEPSAGNPFVLDLVIRNFGLTAAHTVTVDITPWPMRTPGASASEWDRVGIPELPTLAPTQEWRTMWDSGNREGLPDRHEALIRYTGVQGRALESRSVLDWSTHRPRLFTDFKTITDVARALKDLVNSAQAWTESINSRGMKVYVRDGDAKDAETERLWAERRAKREQQQRTEPEV